MNKTTHEARAGGRPLTEQLKGKGRRRREGLKRLAASSTPVRAPRNDLLPRLDLVYVLLEDLRTPAREVRKLDPADVREVATFGGATPVEPKAISPTDPAARYTASANSVVGYAYSDNYLIDLKHAVIMAVEATTAIRQAEAPRFAT
jgi:hypothetical protein